MEHQGNGNLFCNVDQPLNIDLRSKGIETVSGADSNSQSIYAGLLHEASCFFRIGLVRFLFRNIDSSLIAGKLAQLRFYRNAGAGGGFHHLARDFYVFLKGKHRGVDHYGSEPSIDSLADKIVIGGVVQMQSDRHLGVGSGDLSNLG